MRITIAKYLGGLFLMILVSSCYVEYDEVLVDKQDYSFYKFYYYESEFLNNYNYWYYYDYYYREEYASSGMHKYLENGRTLFIDARTADGYSTWSSPKVVVKLTSNTNEALIVFASYFGGGDHNHDMKITSISLSSPPAHLHLCLDRLDEDPAYSIAGKTWITQSVVDENGKSLADDPDWINYTDNLLRFKKTVNFIYAPGSKRSEIELDLFGTESQHRTVSGTYSITENASKKVMLTLSFPNFSQELEVVSSSWTSLTLKGTVKGKTGIMQLVPDPKHDNDYMF